MVNSLKCMKARSSEVLKVFVESQQSESGSQLKVPVAEPMESSVKSQQPESSRLKLLVAEVMKILGRAAAAGSECMETQAAMLVQQLLRVQAARQASSEREEVVGDDGLQVMSTL